MKNIIGILVLMMVLLCASVFATNSVDITSPESGHTYLTSPRLNATISLGNFSECWFNFNGTNRTMTVASNNQSCWNTTVVWNQGSNTVIVYANDTNNTNNTLIYDTVTFTVDTSDSTSNIWSMAVLGFFIGAVMYVSAVFLKKKK